MRLEVVFSSSAVKGEGRRMRSFAGVVLMLAGLVAAIPARAEGAGEGWIPLFDGKSLAGWKHYGGKAKFEARDGAIVGTMVVDDQNSFLATEREFGDFVLEAEFKPESGINSGVQVRSHSSPDFAGGRVHGYQYEIDPTPRALTAGLYEERDRKWLVPKDEPAAREAWKAKGSRLRPGEWNRMRIECRGSHVRTWLNGEPMVDFEDPVKTPPGFIALQVHQTKDPALVSRTIQWRNLRVKLFE
jgi:hypothetical protein